MKDPSIELCRASKKIDWHPIFSRSGLQLANVDSLFNITGHTGGFVRYATFGQFQFAILSNDPGFAEYIIFRRPDSFGYGTFPLKSTQFQTYPVKDFAKTVRQTEVMGVDLVVGDLTPHQFQEAMQLVGEKGSVVFRAIQGIDPLQLQEMKKHFQIVEVVQILSSDHYFVVGLNYGTPSTTKIEIPPWKNLGDSFDYQKALILWNLPEKV